MEKERNDIIHAAPHYPPLIPDDEKITERLSQGPVSEIDLDSLSPTDQILIETEHSLYSFTVLDPSAPCGRLTGGTLGNRVENATIIPSQVESSSSRPGHKSLKAGSRFTFLIESGNSLRRLTVSAVRSLLHKRKGRGNV